MPLADFQTLVTDLSRDDAGKVSVAQRDAALAQAVERYSQDRPRDKVEDINGLGTQLLDLPAGWQDGFSTLTQLEYPIGNVPPTLVPQDDISIYQTPAGQQIQLRYAVANAAANVRITYAVKHVLDAGTDTIPASHRTPVAAWAAADLCEQLASFYAGQTDSTIQADAVDHKSKSAEFASRARALRKRYTDELGVNDRRNTASGVVVALTDRDSRGQPRLTHPLSYRV